MNNFKQNGYGLIEILVVASVGMVVFLSISNCLNSFLKTSINNVNTTEALFLARSSLEQARAVRDEDNEGEGDLDWINIPSFAIGNSYCFKSSGANPAKWAAQPGTKSEERYTIWITVSEVQRDEFFDIVSSGGTVDNNTLKVTSNVSWLTTSGTEQVTLFEYLTNFR